MVTLTILKKGVKNHIVSSKYYLIFKNIIYHPEGNVINELNFHCMVSFVDYDLEWARATGINRTVNRNTFSTRLQGLGFNIHQGTKGERQIKGLKLN